jgi:formylglycine-generating enzyme required for sulfatase activity
VCVGIPQCPAGIAVFGETCAVPQPPAPMIQLGGGAFVMQAPPRTVMVQPFAIDLTEVTVDAYTACVAHGGCSASNVSVSGDGSDARWNAFCNYGKPGKGNHPMNCVDWNQAAAYCQSQVPAKRLPTEAEWEWAARGGPEGRAFPWGGAPPGSQLCWARSTAGTCPVGSFPAGDAPGGIHDMAGNVFEWTASMNNALTPTHAESGGGWAGTYAPSVRAVTGTRMPSTSRYSDLGFRCVR